MKSAMRMIGREIFPSMPPLDSYVFPWGRIWEGIAVVAYVFDFVCLSHILASYSLYLCFWGHEVMIKMTRLLFYFSLTPRLCASDPFPLSKDKLLSPPSDVRMAVQGKKEAHLWKPLILAVCFLGVALTEMVQVGKERGGGGGGGLVHSRELPGILRDN
jgi:hypothetical protein